MTPTEIPVSILPSLEHRRDLVVADYPVLSVLVRSIAPSELWLRHFCEGGHGRSIWFLAGISQRDLKLLEANRVGLRCVLQDRLLAGMGFLVEYAAGEIVSARIGPVPAGYLPATDEPLGDLLEEEGDQFTVFTTERVEPRRGLELSSQVRSLYHYEKFFQKDRSELPYRPFKGGFSVLALRRDVRRVIPVGERAKVQSFQQSSPGFFGFAGKRDAVAALVAAVDRYNSNRKAIRRAKGNLSEYIRRNRILKLKEGPSPAQEAEMGKRATKLVSAMGGADFQRFRELTNDGFQATRFVQAYHNEVQRVADAVRRAELILPLVVSAGDDEDESSNGD